MSILDMNISEIDVLKHACTNFIKINFKKLQHSPRYGKLENVIYPDEFNIPFDIAARAIIAIKHALASNDNIL